MKIKTYKEGCVEWIKKLQKVCDFQQSSNLNKSPLKLLLLLSFMVCLILMMSSNNFSSLWLNMTKIVVLLKLLLLLLFRKKISIDQSNGFDKLILDSIFSFTLITTKIYICIERSQYSNLNKSLNNMNNKQQRRFGRQILDLER